ncbi:MAG: hypothetical protein ACRCZQ_03530, partial [Bacteroidales bacterium]
YRIYVHERTFRNFTNVLSCISTKTNDPAYFLQVRLNSYLGLMKHYRSFRIRKGRIKKNPGIFSYGWISCDFLRFIPANPEELISEEKL